MVDGIFASNALAFSPDSRTMYYGDSRRRMVWAWDFNAVEGSIRNRRVFIELKEGEGTADGAAVDDDGCYWLTQPPASRVVRYDPKGRIDRVIEMPVSQPTCCAFGGPAMDILYVTSAKYRMPAEKLAREPLAGSLFAVRPGVSGPAEARFAG
jgi:sugar lactone lactonase YvrE